jgi:hypothetical protein
MTRQLERADAVFAILFALFFVARALIGTNHA